MVVIIRDQDISGPGPE